MLSPSLVDFLALDLNNPGGGGYWSPDWLGGDHSNAGRLVQPIKCIAIIIFKPVDDKQHQYTLEMSFKNYTHVCTHNEDVKSLKTKHDASMSIARYQHSLT